MTMTITTTTTTTTATRTGDEPKYAEGLRADAQAIDITPPRQASKKGNT
jgi:hypothetical protein